MTTPEILKYIKAEIRSAKKDLKENGNTINSLEATELEDMDGPTAFDYGYLRALECLLSEIE